MAKHKPIHETPIAIHSPYNLLCYLLEDLKIPNTKKLQHILDDLRAYLTVGLTPCTPLLFSKESMGELFPKLYQQSCVTLDIYTHRVVTTERGRSLLYALQRFSLMDILSAQRIFKSSLPAFN
jgi:hypothetical protein